MNRAEVQPGAERSRLRKNLRETAFPIALLGFYPGELWPSHFNTPRNRLNGPTVSLY